MQGTGTGAHVRTYDTEFPKLIMSIQKHVAKMGYLSFLSQTPKL